MRILTTLVALAGLCPAGQTRLWQQSEYGDFEKGVIKNLSLRSDGRLSLAPELKERLDSSSAYLWALAADSAGNLYAGGGPNAKLYRMAPSGETKTLAEFDALEVHAITIDSKDRVYFATSPDGKVYRLTAAAKPEVFYDPKTKYIWALAFSSQGDLFVATGDQGEIHRVAPDGKGSVYFRTEETHARSLAVDAKDNLIVGTEPGGLVIRVSPAGEGFVLHQLPKKELTAVAVAPDGSVYAAGVGAKQPAAPLPAPQPAPVAPVPPVTPGAPTQPRPAAAPPPTFTAGAVPSITGGSEIYRIYADGYPRKVWSHAQDIVYALGLDRDGRVLVGTGNKGAVYRLDSDRLYSALVNTAPTQVTGLCLGRDGAAFAATGNPGKVYQLGPRLAKDGSIESDVFDASLFSQWGRLTFRGEANGGRFSLVTRTGNLDRPLKNWSGWSAPITSEEGGRVASPSARFLQWKATLEGDSAGRSPVLEGVDVAYLPKNVPPRVEIIETTPANYRFPAPPASLTPQQTLTLPPIGKPARGSSSPVEAATPAMQFAKGYIGARWSAADDNQDPLSFTIHIRGVGETEWKLLKENVREKHLSWDSTAYPDGEYRVRVTASDLPANPKHEALSSSLESEILLIDNTGPRISSLTATRSGNRLTIRWRAADALSWIEKAEYSLDGGEWLVVAPRGAVSDSRELDYELTLDAVAPGEHTIAVRVEDEYANQSVEKAVVR